MFEIVSFLFDTPFHQILAQVDLKSLGFRDFSDIVNEAFDDLGHPWF